MNITSIPDDWTPPKDPERINYEIASMPSTPLIETRETRVSPASKREAHDLHRLFLAKFQLDVNQHWIAMRIRPGKQDTVLTLSRELYAQNNVPLYSKLLIGNYICNHSRSNEEISTIYVWIQSVGQNRTNPPNVRSNAIDILKLTNNPLYMLRADNILHQDNLETIPQRRPTTTNNRRRVHIQGIDIGIQQALMDQIHQTHRRKKRQRTIYKDTQTVHNNAINKSVLNTMHDLHQKYESNTIQHPPLASLMNQFDDVHIRRKIKKAHDRIMTDSSKFKHGMTLRSSFNNLVHHIQNHEHRPELEKRLGEEMVEMAGKCASGHLARMANTLQGFEDRIVMDPKDEVYAKLSHVIQQRAQADDAIMDVLMDPGSTQFNKMVKDTADTLLPELQDEYKTYSREDIAEALDKSVTKYTGV
ncbi:hypothetical protein OAV62_01570 [bacterium]|nr:hypothetical protein [bacterium]